VITTKTPQERLRSKVRQAAEILHEQGPISTFIHTNPLHGLEHLPFEQAVAERLLGRRAYLPNKEYRQLYRNGRIFVRYESQGQWATVSMR
jgi:uncharacterized protein YbcC (UPF0753/DUF2309 family)